MATHANQKLRTLTEPVFLMIMIISIIIAITIISAFQTRAVGWSRLVV